MKVLVITNSVSEKSGWGRYSGAIVREYPKLGIECKVIDESALLKPSNSWPNIFSNISAVKNIAKDFDIIHAFDGWPYGVYGYLAAKKNNKKLFINGVGTYSVDPLNNFFKAFFLKKAYRYANKIFCISNYTKKKISDKIKLDNLETVFLGTPVLDKIPEAQIEEYKTNYGIKEQYPIFLTVGAIKGRKGQYDSLRAISKLKNKYPNFKYFIVGSDKDKKYIELITDFVTKHKLEANVQIINSANDEFLAFFYQISNIFLLNSANKEDYFEGFGLVLLEAAQFGLPVIGSKDCGISDAIEYGYNGYLTEQRNSEDIYQKIQKILESDFGKLSDNSIEFSKRFTWQKTVSKYKEYYNN